ncbi:unnamed protein product [Paramecium sonneborni]|uniref:Transmembrane protein n=1 Tax=Paramecium sonneborni TaxID=65129 RepID=A0A8S1QRF4_9CILI|nr:unnamed protein product [Paramecium sonneborni]
MYTSYEKNQPNEPLNYIVDSLENNQTQYSQQFSVESIENDQKFKDSLKRADYISSVYAALVIENFIILAVILLGLYSQLQFGLITKNSNIKDYCYCETQKAQECDNGCLISQKDNYEIIPTSLFYIFLIIGAILQIWLNYGIIYILKNVINYNVFLLCINDLNHLHIDYLQFWNCLDLIGWVNAFVIISCYAFYTMKTKSEINYGSIIHSQKLSRALFIFTPTLLFLIAFSTMAKY